MEKRVEVGIPYQALTVPYRIFKKGSLVPWWVQRTVPPDLPGADRLRFGVDCRVQIINGETFVWPLRPIRDSDCVIDATSLKNDENHSFGKKYYLVGFPTKFYEEPLFTQPVNALQKVKDFVRRWFSEITF